MHIQVFQYDIRKAEQGEILIGFAAEMTAERRALMHQTWEGDIDPPPTMVKDIADANPDDPEKQVDATMRMIAERVFYLLNQDDRPTAKTSYSMSMGDVVLITDLNGTMRAYMTEEIGFSPVAVELFIEPSKEAAHAQEADS